MGSFVCADCGGPKHLGCHYCWGCYHRGGPARGTPEELKERPDLPGVPIFHDWGPRPASRGDLRAGQVWRYAPGQGSAGGGLYSIQREPAPQGSLLTVRKIGESFDQQMGGPFMVSRWEFVRHPFDHVERLATSHLGLLWSERLHADVMTHPPIEVKIDDMAKAGDPDCRHLDQAWFGLDLGCRDCGELLKSIKDPSVRAPADPRMVAMMRAGTGGYTGFLEERPAPPYYYYSR